MHMDEITVGVGSETVHFQIHNGQLTLAIKNMYDGSVKMASLNNSDTDKVRALIMDDLQRRVTQRPKYVSAYPAAAVNAQYGKQREEDFAANTPGIIERTENHT